MDYTVTDAITVDKNQYEQEQSDLVKVILSERFFKPWLSLNECGYITKEEYQKNVITASGLEIFITSTCNQSCEYCYLYKNKDLYPPQFNNKELILNNLRMLYDWIEGKKFIIPNVEFFSGEIWHNDYGLEVLEITYQSLLRYPWTKKIMIPSNCSFVLNESQLEKVQRYINKFKRINVALCFSISVDGAVVEEVARPLNNKQVKTEEFYDRLFLFANHNNFLFHPMVAACDIDKWIENFQWWEKMCEKYDRSISDIMTLEVRNNDWTSEKIQQYTEFLDFLIENYKTKYCKNDNTIFFQHLLSLVPSRLSGYVPFGLMEADNFAGCSIAEFLTVRVGDLAICPCHRTAYNKFLYGKFKVENNEIVDIIGNNPQMAARVLMANNTYTSLQCDVCVFNHSCLKGCFGSQFETEGDPFIPIKCVCDLFTAKYTFLVKKYIDMGIIPFLDSLTPYHPMYLKLQNTLYFIERVQKEYDL